MFYDYGTLWVIDETGEDVDSLFQKIFAACFQNKDKFPSRMRETFKLVRDDVDTEQGEDEQEKQKDSREDGDKEQQQRGEKEE